MYPRIGGTCMYKSPFNSTAFVKARVAQSIEYRATNLNIVGSSPIVGKNFSFCI